MSRLLSYFYNCPNCGKLELKKRMVDPEFKICPTCGETLERIFTPTVSIWATDGAYSHPNVRNDD